MASVEKANLINSVEEGRQKLIKNYEKVDRHYKKLYEASDKEKYKQEMEFYSFIISQWDNYKMKVENEELSLN